MRLQLYFSANCIFLKEDGIIEKLTDLHTAVAELLLVRILSGDATAAEISNAIKFLKDNNINCDGNRNEILQDLTHNLPSPDELEEML